MRLVMRVKYKKAWYAKHKAISSIFGDWETSYRILPKFMNVLNKYNIGTIVHFESSQLTYDRNFNYLGEVLDKKIHI